MKKTSAGQGPAIESNKKLAAARQAKAVVPEVLVPELGQAQPADAQADALNEQLPVAAAIDAVLPESAASASYVLVADSSGGADVAGRILLAQASGPVAPAAAPAAAAPAVTGMSTSTMVAIGAGGLALAAAAGGGGGGAPVNSAPVISAVPTRAATEGGEAVTGKLVATDADVLDKLTFTTGQGQTPVPGLTLNADGTYSFNPKDSAYASMKAGEVRVVTYKFTVADGQGGTANGELTINLVGANTAPAAVAAAAAATEAGTVVSGTVVATDVDSATLTYSVASLPAGLTFNANGSYSFDPAVSAYNTLAAGATSVLTVAYTVTDGALTSTANLVITVTGTNDGPVAQAMVATGLEDAASIAITPVSSDVDSGDTATYSVDTLPAHGKVVFNAVSGKFDYTPDANYNGTDSFTYKVTDSKGATSVAAASVTVTAQGDAPVAQAAAGAAFEGATLAGTVVATDVDSSALTFSLNAAAPAGLTFNADGSYSFDAAKDQYNSLAAGQKQVITVGYTVTDGALTSTANLVITVTGTNDGPVASDVIASGLEDAASISITPVSTDVDTGDNSPIYSVDTKPAHGTVVFNADTQQFDYTPNANWNGTDSFTYKATDASGATSLATATVTVGAVNDAPVPSNEQREAIEGGATVSGKLTASDLDSSALTFALVGAAPAGLTTFNPDGSYTFDPKDYAYTDLAVGEVRTVTIAYTVSDGDKSSTANLVIDVTGTNNDILLTTALDDLRGGKDNNRFIANAATFNPNDQIDGDEGHDTLRLTLGTADVLPSVVVRSVEQVDIQTGLNPFDQQMAVNVVSMSGFDGSVEQINIHDAKTGVAVTDQQSLADVTITDSSGLGFGVTLTYDQQVVAGDNDTLNLSVNEFSGGKPEQGLGEDREAGLEIGAGIETLSLTVADAPGAESVIALSAESLTQIDVKGGIVGQGLYLSMQDLNDAPQALVTLDATDFVGDLTLDDINGAVEGQANELSTVLLAAGDDTVTVVSNDLASGDLYSLGEGNNQLAVADGSIRGTVITGTGDDTVGVQNDLDDAFISLGDGVNTLVVLDDSLGSEINVGDGTNTVNVGDNIDDTLFVAGNGTNSVTFGNVAFGDVDNDDADILPDSLITASTFTFGDGTNTLRSREGSSAEIQESDITFGQGTNTLTIDDDFEGSTVTFGDGTNTMTVGDDLEQSDGGRPSIVTFGVGTNSLVVGGDLDGDFSDRTVITFGGDSENTLTVGDDLDDTKIYFGDNSENAIAVNDQVDHSEIHLGNNSSNTVDLYEAFYNSDLFLGSGGANVIHIGDDVGESTITINASADPNAAPSVISLTIGGDVGGGSHILLAGGLTVASIDETVRGGSQVIFGNGNDSLTLGDGYDEAGVYGDSTLTLVDLSDGDDAVTVLDSRYDYSRPWVQSGAALEGGAGDDILTVKAVDDLRLVGRDEQQEVEFTFSGDGDSVARFAVGQDVSLTIDGKTYTYKVLASDIVQGSGAETGANVAEGLLAAVDADWLDVSPQPAWDLFTADQTIENKLIFRGGDNQPDLTLDFTVGDLSDSDPNPLTSDVVQLADAHIGGFETLQLVALNATSGGNDNENNAASIYADFALIDDVADIHLHSEMSDSTVDIDGAVTFTLDNLHGGERIEVSGYETTTFAATAIETVTINSTVGTYMIGDHIRLRVGVGHDEFEVEYTVVEADLVGSSGAADAALIAGKLAAAAQAAADAVPDLADMLTISVSDGEVSIEADQDLPLTVDAVTLRDDTATITDVAFFDSAADNISFSREAGAFMAGDVVSVTIGDADAVTYTITEADLERVAGREDTYNIAVGVTAELVEAGFTATAVHGLITGVDSDEVTVTVERPVEVELGTVVPTVTVNTSNESQYFLPSINFAAGQEFTVNFSLATTPKSVSYELTADDVFEQSAADILGKIIAQLNSALPDQGASFSFYSNNAALGVAGNTTGLALGSITVTSDDIPVTTVTTTQEGVMQDDGVTDVVVNTQLADDATDLTMRLTIDGEGDFDLDLQGATKLSEVSVPQYTTLVADVSDSYSHTVDLSGQFSDEVTFTGGMAGESLVLENVDTKVVNAEIDSDVTVNATADMLEELNLGTGQNTLSLSWGSQDAVLADLIALKVTGNLQTLVLENDLLLGSDADGAVSLTLDSTTAALAAIDFSDVQLSDAGTEALHQTFTIGNTAAKLHLESGEDFGTVTDNGNGNGKHNNGPASQTILLQTSNVTDLTLSAAYDVNVAISDASMETLDVHAGRSAELSLHGVPDMTGLTSVKLVAGYASLDISGQSGNATVELRALEGMAQMDVSDSDLGNVALEAGNHGDSYLALNGTQGTRVDVGTVTVVTELDTGPTVPVGGGSFTLSVDGNTNADATVGAVSISSFSDADVSLSGNTVNEDDTDTAVFTMGDVVIDAQRDGAVAINGNAVSDSSGGSAISLDITLGKLGKVALETVFGSADVDLNGNSASDDTSLTVEVGDLSIFSGFNSASLDISGNSELASDASLSITLGNVEMDSLGAGNIAQIQVASSVSMAGNQGASITLGTLDMYAEGAGARAAVSFAGNSDADIELGDVTMLASGGSDDAASTSASFSIVGDSSTFLVGTLDITAEGSDSTVSMSFQGNSEADVTIGAVTVDADGAITFDITGTESTSFDFSDATFTAEGSDGYAPVSLDFVGNSDADFTMDVVDVTANGNISFTMVGDHGGSTYEFGNVTLTGEGASDAAVSISFQSDAATTFTMGDVDATAKGDISFSVADDTLKSKYTFGKMDLTAEGSGANVTLDFQSDRDAAFTFGDITATGTSDSGLTISDDSASTYTFSDATITANGTDADVRVLIDGSNNSTIKMGALQLDADSNASFDFTGGEGSKLNLDLASTKLKADGDASLSIIDTQVAANGGSLLEFGNVTLAADQGSDDAATITIGGAGSNGVDGIGINLGYNGAVVGTVTLTGNDTGLSIENTTNAKVQVGALTMSSNDKGTEGDARIELSDSQGVFKFNAVNMTTSDGEATVSIHDNGELGLVTTITVGNVDVDGNGWEAGLYIQDNVGSATGSKKTTVTVGDVDISNTASDGWVEVYINDNSDAAITLGDVTMDAADTFGGTRAAFATAVGADLAATDGDFNLSSTVYDVEVSDGYDSFFEIEGNTGAVTAVDVSVRGYANTLAIYDNTDVTLGDVTLVGKGSTVAVFENAADSTVTLGDLQVSGILAAVYLDAENSSDSTITDMFDLAFGTSDDLAWSADGQKLEDLSGLGKTGYDAVTSFDSDATIDPTYAIWDSLNSDAGTLDAFGMDSDGADASYMLTVGDKIDVDGLRVLVALDHVEGGKAITVHGSKEAVLDNAFTVTTATDDPTLAGKSVVLLEYTPDVQTLTITGATTIVVLSGDMDSFKTLDLADVGESDDDGISYVYTYDADFRDGSSALTTDDRITVNLGSGDVVYNALDTTAGNLTDAKFVTAGGTSTQTVVPGSGNDANEFFHFGGSTGEDAVGKVVLGGFTLTGDPATKLKSSDGDFKDILDFTDFDWNGSAAGKGDGDDQLKWAVDTTSGDVTITFTNTALTGSILLVGAATGIADIAVDDWISNSITGATGARGQFNP